MELFRAVRFDFLVFVEVIEQRFDVLHGLENSLGEAVGACDRTAFCAGKMEEDVILAGNDVRHAVAVVRHGTEATARRHQVWVLLDVNFRRLAVRSLTGRQPPRFAERFLQKWRLDFKVFRDNVETEQVPVNTSTTHRIKIALLVAVASFRK